MAFKYLVALLILSSTNGLPFTLGNVDTQNPPLAQEAAADNGFSVLNGYLQSQNKSGSSGIVLYIFGGNVSVNLNGLTVNYEVNNRSEAASKPMETLVTEPVYNRFISNESDYTVTYRIEKHNLHTEPKTWLQAENICFQEGGHLVVINSRAEEERVWNMIKSDGYEHGGWVGVHEMFRTGQWVTVHDEPLSEVGYAKWAPGEPSGSGNHCVVLFTQGLYNVSCVEKRRFVCEINTTI